MTKFYWFLNIFSMYWKLKLCSEKMWTIHLKYMCQHNKFHWFRFRFKSVFGSGFGSKACILVSARFGSGKHFASGRSLLDVEFAKSILNVCKILRQTKICFIYSALKWQVTEIFKLLSYYHILSNFVSLQKSICSQ